MQLEGDSAEAFDWLAFNAFTDDDVRRAAEADPTIHRGRRNSGRMHGGSPLMAGVSPTNAEEAASGLKADAPLAPCAATRYPSRANPGARMPLSPSTRDKLKTVSVATLTTALFKRGLRHQFIQDVRPLNPGLPNMVGEAFTLRYIPAREDLNPLSVFQDRGHPQRKAVEDCPPGAVFVIDSRKDARAASAGGILVSRLMVRGVAGVVTDGGFRDSPEIAKLAIPAYHNRPASPTNLTLHHAIDINVPIGCGDAPVFPGDVVVGDGEGVVVLPANIADELAAEAVEMTAFEDFVQEEVLKGRSILGLYPATDPQTKVDFEAWRKQAGR
jgi:regulator of RNase E activity RraA